jgi:vacuolar-type H+-ATPase subunit F/Vma7
VSRAVAIGDARRLAGYALAGAEVVEASSRDEAEAALARVDDELGLLVLTPEAHSALATALEGRDDLVWVVIPA